MGFLCLELKPKEKSALAELLDKTSYKDIQKNLQMISGPTIYRLTSKK